MARILLVEDNETNQDMLSRRLSRRGFDVLIAMNCEDGIVSADTNKPDLILMDISLPRMSGWDAILQLKAAEKTSWIPIIALTAHALDADREKALSCGCGDFASKPVDLPDLLNKIERLLSAAHR